MIRNKKYFLLGSLILLSLLLSACGTAFGASGWPGITFDEEQNTVYIAYNQHVYALQAENGVETWRFPQEAENGISFFATPLISSTGEVIIGGYDKQVFSLDPNNRGRQNWSFSDAADRYIGAIASDGHNLYAPNADNSLYALSDKGQLLWSFQTDEAIWSAPVTFGDKVIVASMDHKLYALRTQNGSRIWEQDLGGTVVADPVIDEAGNIYLGTFGKEILAVSADTGRILWRTSTEEWIWGGPTVSNGFVYASDIGGTLYALDADNGREKWRVTANGTITGSPLVTSDRIIVSTENGQVMAVSLDGRIQWTKTIDDEGQAYSSPVAAGELTLIGIVEGESILIALDGNGNQVWSFTPQN